MFKVTILESTGCPIKSCPAPRGGRAPYPGVLVLTVRPIELRDANAFVAERHRHHKPVVGHRFSLCCYRRVWCGDCRQGNAGPRGLVDYMECEKCSGRGTLDPILCGVVIVGRPVSRHYPPLEVVEVTRLCTDGTTNACSILYAAAARAARAMGYKRIQTYTLPTEGGASLRASGWECEGEQESSPWFYSEAQGVLPGMPNRRQDQPNGNKMRWARSL